MAHFAELNKKNVVIRVIAVNNDVLLDENGIEQEQKGIEFCEKLLGGKWIQTSLSGKFRKHFAGEGFFYDKSIDAFIPPKPKQFPSWLLDINLCNWVAPHPPPNDGKFYRWDEDTLSWVEYKNILTIDT